MSVCLVVVPNLAAIPTAAVPIAAIPAAAIPVVVRQWRSTSIWTTSTAYSPL